MKNAKTLAFRSSSDRREGGSRPSSRAAWCRLAVGSLLCAASISWTTAASSGHQAPAPLLNAVDDLVIAMPAPDDDSDGQTAGSSMNRAEEHEVNSGARPKLKTKIVPFHPRRRAQSANVARGGGLCPPVPVTHSDVPWGGTDVELIAQAGLVEQEIAAASFEIDPAEYPITLQSVEMIWSAGSENPSTTITVVWDLWIWRGTPDGGGLLENFPEPSIGADLGGQLPDIVVDPVNPAVNVFIQLGEAGDEIILTQEDLPDNILSVGARVLEHNLEPTQDQDCGFGIILPAECVGPVPSFNAFPTTFDTQGIGSVGNEPTMNWLFARPGCGDCALAGGWYRFSDMGIFQPSGDWNIRLTYQPTECPEDIGACCVDGVCIGDDILNTDCVAQGGEFQGDGVLCADVDCPVPTGACCYDPGDGTQICEDGFTQAQCANEMNSLYLGDDSTCGPGACDPPTGACCFEQGLGNQVCDVLTQAECAALPLSTYFGDDTVCGPDICIGACCNPEQGTCVSTTRSLCELAGLIWRGEGLDCETFSCFGVCCMPDGSCENNGGIGLLEEDCAAMGGVWDDSTTDCAEADCPDPLGACCLQSGACLQLDEATCLSLNGDWGGAASTCVEFCVDPTGACCFSNGNCAESLTESNCLDLGGTWSEGQVCATVCSCPGDSDGDNIVGLSDLLDVLSNWGSGGSSGGDVNNDLSVDLSDLLEVLSNWGSSCE